MFSIELLSPKQPEVSLILQDENYTVYEASVRELNVWKLFSTTLTHITWDFAVLHPSRSTAILILAIPPKMSPDELISFIRKTTLCPIKITIIIHIVHSVILEFETQKDADAFYVNTLGESFYETHSLLRCIPLFLKDAPGLNIHPACTISEENPRDFSFSGCPLCFQLFDPFITTFYSQSSYDNISDAAYIEWGSPNCSVCKVIHNHSPHTCHSCSEDTRLWICLTCGHVGCGRDQKQHAVQHYEQTKHRFALRYDDNWLWDYADDRSVDRSFHDHQMEANAEAICNYRRMLLTSIGDVMDDEKRQIDNVMKEAEPNLLTLKAKLAEIKQQQQEIECEYEEAHDIEMQMNEARQEIKSIKESAEMNNSNLLQKENHDLKRRLESINKQIEELCNALDGTKK